MLVALTHSLTKRQPTSPATQADAATTRPLKFDAPAFSLIDQDSHPLALADLRGKPWIADLIFTGCANTCPILSQRMSRLQSELDGRIHFVSFDVDPDNDAPAKLRTYALSYQADFTRWHFLAAPSRSWVFQLARGLHVQCPTNERDYVLLHSDSFFLIDKAGRVRGTYDSGQPASLARLRSDAAALLGE